jgi:hypothetical protein
MNPLFFIVDGAGLGTGWTRKAQVCPKVLFTVHDLPPCCEHAGIGIAAVPVAVERDGAIQGTDVVSRHAGNGCPDAVVEHLGQGVKRAGGRAAGQRGPGTCASELLVPCNTLARS